VAETWIDVSRVVPPIARGLAVGWLLDRLTGRAMRHRSAIADLLVLGLAGRAKTGGV
jgi:hypothetical protein